MQKEISKICDRIKLLKEQIMEEEMFYDIVFMETNSDIEETETYENYKSAKENFNTMKSESEFYDYVVLRKVCIYDDTEEDIEELEYWYKDEQEQSMKQKIKVYNIDWCKE